MSRLYEQATVLAALRDNEGAIHSWLVDLGGNLKARLPVEQQKVHRKTGKPAILKRGDKVAVCEIRRNVHNHYIIVSEQQAATRLVMKRLYKLGWEELFPEQDRWTFRKNNWECLIFVGSGRAVFRKRGSRVSN